MSTDRSCSYRRRYQKGFYAQKENNWAHSGDQFIVEPESITNITNFCRLFYQNNGTRLSVRWLYSWKDKSLQKGGVSHLLERVYHKNVRRGRQDNPWLTGNERDVWQHSDNVSKRRLEPLWDVYRTCFEYIRRWCRKGYRVWKRSRNEINVLYEMPTVWETQDEIS